MWFLLLSKRVRCFCLSVVRRDLVSVISKSSSILSNSSLSIVLKKWYLMPFLGKKESRKPISLVLRKVILSSLLEKAIPSVDMSLINSSVTEVNFIVGTLINFGLSSG